MKSYRMQWYGCLTRSRFCDNIICFYILGECMAKELVLTS